MRNIIGLIVGFYLTAALVVFAAAAWSFNTEPRWKTGPCANPDWMGWAAYRAIAWPKTYFDDQDKVSALTDWLMVNYTPFPGACR